MPELPEVETTINGLKNKVLKRTFLDVWTDWYKIKPSLIKGKKINNIYRKGKNIIFDLSDDYYLLIHQKMTGHLLYGKFKKINNKWIGEKGALKNDPMNRFIHLILFLDNGKQIALSDLRKFAKVKLGKTKEIEKEISSLGPDALKISFKEFKQRIKKGKIKQVLMKQELISGIGNIYSDEILFEAKINPLKTKLTEIELKRIYQAMKKVLKKAIKLQGTSISDYRTITGEKGGFDKIRKVYRRTGEKCYNCSTLIKRIKIGGRSAHFCPKCQKL